jgi:hypothetical protein
MRTDWPLHAIGPTLPLLAALGSMSMMRTHAAQPPAPVTISLAATSVVGGVGTTATITLASTAPAGGTIVTIASAPPVTIRGGANQVSLVGQIGPTSIRVPQGASQVTISLFTAGVAAVTTSTITAKSGSDSSVAALTIRPASITSLSLNPSVVTGGQSTSLHIVLDGAAPGGTGVDVALVAREISALADGSVRTISSSAAPSAVVPTTVHFPPGSSTLTVPVATNPVARAQSLTLSMQLGKLASAPLTVNAPIVSSIALQPSIVLAGSPAQATLMLNGPAPAGFVVPITTSRADVTASSPVTVPQGATSTTFPVATSANLAAGSSPITASVSVGGAKASTTPAIADGTSNTIAVGELTSVPSASLTVVPVPLLQSTTMSPTTVTAGDPIVLSLSLASSGTLSSGSGAGTVLSLGPALGAGSATISVDQPSIVHLPASVNVATNVLSLAVNGTTSPPPSDATVTIKTTFRDRTFSNVVVVKVPPPPLELFALRPTTVKGGGNVIASLKLPSTASSARVISLSTDHPELISLPATVTVPVSAVATPFTFRTQPTAAETRVTVTATVGAQQMSAALTITP